ncbi:MAG: hypothetical protein ACREXR_20010 [Gammaproteobacteria bacterium]
MHRYALTLLLLAVSLYAPASSISNYGPVYAGLKQRGSGGGCITGTVGTTLPGKNFNMTVSFAAEGNSEGHFKLGSFGLTLTDKRHDVVVGPLRASAFRMCLKPGRYEIIAMKADTTFSKTRVRVPFEVVGGEDVYLGSFIFHNAESNPQRCPGAPYRLYVEVRDESARDLLLVAKLAKSPDTRTKVDVVDSSAGAPYFIECGQGQN